ncbi:MAG TPA: prepilin-type N-terminal cleavage/methylation domain-containing protein [Desulfobacterales bacterium]|nr:prepilin-type N-terminal cleavage/methylation domain-containing protein [Desulfobacterales bacterium]
MAQKGFSLLELLIVVTIVGILAAVAIPAYSDFVTRTKLSEIFLLLDKAATAASEYHSIHESGFPSDIGLIQPAGTQRYGPIEVISANQREGSYGIRNLKNFPPPVLNRHLYIRITYDPATGYSKSWDTDLPHKFHPRE